MTPAGAVPASSMDSREHAPPAAAGPSAPTAAAAHAASMRRSPHPVRLQRRNGILVPPRGHMAPLFAVTLVLAMAGGILAVTLPFLATRYSDSPWQDPARLGFLGQALLASLVFGAIVGTAADRRGHSAWWSLAGWTGLFAAGIQARLGIDREEPALARLVAFTVSAATSIGALELLRRRPAPPEPALEGFTRPVCRVLHAAGNIWFGIGLLLLLIGALFLGGFYESWYGPKAARAAIYTGPGFGALLLLFTNSLIAATLRKYPWRVAQTGWIVTHVALVGLLVGSFLSFFGKEEGELYLEEGQRADRFSLETETRLVIDEDFLDVEGDRRRRNLLTLVSDFDLNPKRREFSRRIPLRDGAETLALLEVDRYYAHSRPEEVRDDQGASERAGLDGRVVVRGMAPQILNLAEGQPGQMLGGLVEFEVRRPPHPGAGALLARGGHMPDDATLVVRRRNGDELARFPVGPGARPANASDGPASLDLDAEIPGTGLRLVGRFWFDDWQLRPGAGVPFDARPGVPLNPAAGVLLRGPAGEEPRWAFSWYRGQLELSRDPRYPDLEVELDYLPLPSGLLLFWPEPDGRLMWSYRAPSSGEVRSGTASPGASIELGPFVRIEVDRVYRRLRTRTTRVWAGYGPEHQAIRIGRVDAPEEERIWLPLGGGERELRAGNRRLRVRWEQRPRDLGFELELADFHRDFHPGTRNPRTFESWLWLRHPLKGEAIRAAYEEAVPDHGSRPRAGDAFILIDMNNPLRLDGWRLFQARFSAGDAGGGAREATILQVNRDPGLPLTYASAALLLLGLVIVFFQKPYLRSLGHALELQGASVSRRFAHALGTVGLAFLATAPGVLVIVLLPEGPVKGLGVIVIMAGLALESLLLHWRHRRRNARLQANVGPHA